MHIAKLSPIPADNTGNDKKLLLQMAVSQAHGSHKRYVHVQSENSWELRYNFLLYILKISSFVLVNGSSITHHVNLM